MVSVVVGTILCLAVTIAPFMAFFTVLAGGCIPGSAPFVGAIDEQLPSCVTSLPTWDDAHPENFSAGQHVLYRGYNETTGQPLPPESCKVVEIPDPLTGKTWKTLVECHAIQN